MNTLSSKAGARSSCEDGPSAALSGRFDFPDGQDRLSATLGVIGRNGARAAGLALAIPAGDGENLDIAVVDEAGRTLLRLGPYAEEDVIAVWRALGAASGLSLMIRHEDERIERPFPQVGRVQLGPIRIRRRHGLLSGRRPRFLVRRKPTRLPMRPLVYREREIFSREQA
jgi:Family of unknown function (DUF6101)